MFDTELARALLTARDLHDPMAANNSQEYNRGYTQGQVDLLVNLFDIGHDVIDSQAIVNFITKTTDRITMRVSFTPADLSKQIR
jgi:hypothetical protein